MSVKKLSLKKIRIDGGTQARAVLNQKTVAEYCELWQDGAEFPPILVYFDGSDHWLVDGFHRYFGAKAAGLGELDADIQPGTQRDAILAAVGSNDRHGLQRTNADKRRCVEILLADPEWSQWSDREIAKRAGVSDRFVNGIRAALRTVRNAPDPATRKTSDGRQYPAARKAAPAERIQACPASKPSDSPATVQRQLSMAPVIESVAIRMAHEAVNALKRIPRNDPKRNEGYQIVRNFLDGNEDK